MMEFLRTCIQETVHRLRSNVSRAEDIFRVSCAECGVTVAQSYLR